RRGGGREAVSGDALRIEVVDEAVDGCTWQPVRIAGGGIEQRDDPVEIPVRAVTERPTALGLPQPTPLQTALLPQPPQDLFEPGSRLVSLPRGRQQVDDSTYRRRLHLAESGENVRAPQREHQQFVTRTVAARRGFQPTQATAQFAQRHRIGTAERRGQQHLRELGVQQFRIGGNTQQREQRTNSRATRQRQFLPNVADGDTGSTQRAADRGYRPRRR